MPSDNSGNCKSNSGIEPGVSASTAARVVCTNEKLTMAPSTPYRNAIQVTGANSG